LANLLLFIICGSCSKGLPADPPLVAHKHPRDHFYAATGIW
jgi:hypothetical protein